MGASEPQTVDRRELELSLREAELNRREARLVRAASERGAHHDARELQLTRREQALAALAGELAAERERLTAVRMQLLKDMKRLEQRRLQASPRWYAAPAAEQSSVEDAWWAKVLGRSGNAVA
jgi:hypothetical protein